MGTVGALVSLHVGRTQCDLELDDQAEVRFVIGDAAPLPAAQRLSLILSLTVKGNLPGEVWQSAEPCPEVPQNCRRCSL